MAHVPTGLLQPPAPLPAARGSSESAIIMPAHRSLRDFDWLMSDSGVPPSALRESPSANLQRHPRYPLHGKLGGNRGSGYWPGSLALWIGTLIDYHTLLGQVPILYGLSLATLIATFAVGTTVFGSRRWIGSPTYHIQPSEFVKLVIVLLVARYLSEMKGEELELRDLLKLAGLVGLPMIMIMLQPDLGTALTFVPILGIGVFLAGFRWQYAVAILAIVAVVAPIGYWLVLKDYQRERVVSFLDPSQDPKGSGYQVIQSKIAVGSGALWGRGVTKGTQTQGRFLPVPQKDFIFSAFAEEHGFVGVIVALGLYFLLLMQIVQNAQTASDKAPGMYICMGVCRIGVVSLCWWNVGMVVGRDARSRAFLCR